MGSRTARTAQRRQGAQAALDTATPQASEGSKDTGLSTLEMRRMEQMKRNADRLRSLDIPALATGVQELSAKKTTAKPRGVTPKRKRSDTEAVPPPRRSLRSKGMDAEAQAFAGGVMHESRGGGITLAQQTQASNAEAATAAGAEVPPAVVVPVDRDIESLNCEAQEDEAYLKDLVSRAVEDKPIRGFDCSKLALVEENVAKVTKDGVVGVAFMPRTDASILAVSDKKGHVGLWNQNPTAAEPASSLGDDGVLLLKPHRSYVSGLAWLARDAPATSLVTCSYDGSVVRIDLAARRFLVAYHEGDAEFSCMGVHDGNSILLGDPMGNLTVVDLRAGEPATVAAELNLHNRKINSISFHKPGAQAASHVFATSSSDGSISIWDLRKLRGGAKKKTTPLATAQHDKSCHNAVFQPAGELLLSTSFDNTIRVWDCKRMSGAVPEVAKVTHNNQTGRWITPFQAIWTPDGADAICGDMKRGISHVWAASQGSLSTLHSSEFMTAIPSRFACHSSRGIVAAGTGSGRIHLWTAP